MISDLQNYIANEITEIESVEPATSELLSKMSERMEVKFFNDDGAGGFENFERGVEDGDDWRGSCVIVGSMRLRGTPRRLPLAENLHAAT